MVFAKFNHVGEIDGIEMSRLSEEKVASLLNKMIQYDADKKSVLVTLGDKIVQEIPLSAYERSYWEEDPSKPLENEIEYIDYVNDWWYVTSCKALQSKSVFATYGFMIFWGGKLEYDIQK